MKTFPRRLADRAIGRAFVGALALAVAACEPAAEPPKPRRCIR